MESTKDESLEDKLIASATKMFAKKGFEASSTREIFKAKQLQLLRNDIAMQ